MFAGIFGLRPTLGCYNTSDGLLQATFTRDTVGEHCLSLNLPLICLFRMHCEPDQLATQVLSNFDSGRSEMIAFAVLTVLRSLKCSNKVPQSTQKVSPVA